MFTTSIEAAGRTLRAEQFPHVSAGVPRAVFLIDPDGFALAAESAIDNEYMDTTARFNSARAIEQAHQLKLRLAAEGITALSFAGSSDTPDALFPNNVFATAPGRVVFAAMRHPVRQREAQRSDIRRFFTDVLGYQPVDLGTQSVVAELTGSLVIDRARQIAWCGLSDRCDLAGAQAMHEAFALKATFAPELSAGEYHTNVVMSALAGRGVVIAPDGFADPAAAQLIQDFYAPAVVAIDPTEKAEFAGNCIALTPDTLWMSQRAADGLRPASLAAIEGLGFRVVSVALDEVEKAGGSLRCMIGEIY